jgi:hypothetical protein
MAFSLINRSDLDRARDAVARLESRLGQARAAVDRARKAHAAAGVVAEMAPDDRAARVKAERTKKALADASADAADAELFLAAARGHLVAAEARAEAERVAKARQRTRELCDTRDALARRVQDAFVAGFDAFGELMAVENELTGALPLPRHLAATLRGPGGGLGPIALAGALEGFLRRAGLPHHLRLGTGGINAPDFADHVARRSADILAAIERAGTGSDAGAEAAA